MPVLLPGSATISPCGLYRYTLTRHIASALRWYHPCLFIMLNPSTANATEDDPTIRRCRGFATRLSCTEFTVVNLFALRATDPKALIGHPDPIGPENDAVLTACLAAHRISPIIAAWGSAPIAWPRAHQLAPIFAPYQLQALSITKAGAPGHPLYLPADAPLQPFTVSKD